MNWRSTSEPFVGALLIIKWNANSDKGHNTFIVGETPDGEYWWGLGGNQSIPGQYKGHGITVNVARFRKNGTITSIRKPANFDPCETYKQIPKYTAEEVMARSGKESGSAQDYGSTR